jgi:Protein of unknown function TPD sequence-motif
MNTDGTTSTTSSAPSGLLSASAEDQDGLPTSQQAGRINPRQANHMNYRNRNRKRRNRRDSAASGSTTEATTTPPADANGVNSNECNNSIDRVRRRPPQHRRIQSSDRDDHRDTQGTECDQAADVHDTTIHDPFYYVLRCFNPHQELPHLDQSNPLNLYWYSPFRAVATSCEAKLESILLHWGKHKESGMMCHQPRFRLAQLREAVQRQREASSISLAQALSLRRHYIKMNNPYRSMSQLRLGQEQDIRESARILEHAVAMFLQRQGIPVYSEHQQVQRYHDHHREQKRISGNPALFLPKPPTPDFVFQQPVLLRRYFYGDKDKFVEHDPVHIYWLEVKMFYGASTVDWDHASFGAVGCLRATAVKYVATYGPGAIVFFYGCGDDLQQRLSSLGVTVVDAGGGRPESKKTQKHSIATKDYLPYDPQEQRLYLEDVYAHQRTWCSDRNGNILP